MSNQTHRSNNSLDQDIAEFEDQTGKRVRILRQILDEVTSAEDKYLAVAAKMGSNKSYISSVPLKWFADINFASDLDIFKEYRDENNKSIEINESTLGMLSQRKPDWSRQLAMTVYLAIREHHKFPPALLVAYQDWILDKDHNNWGMDGCALQDSLTHEALDSKNWVVNLNQHGTKFYALDGQHRLMATRGLRDLIQGSLPKKNKEGRIEKFVITIDDVLEHHTKGDGNQRDDLRRKIESILDSEKIGVEIIPAVQAGETLDEAFRRLRQVFVDVNQNARSLEKGELALLDEVNGFSIVARSVMVTHRLFRAKGDSLRVDVKASQLNEKNPHYTTLQTITSIAKSYLGQLEEFEHWENHVCGINGAGMLRPDDDELDAGRQKLKAYFDAMMTLPSHQDMIQGAEVQKFRMRVDDGGQDNVLFRTTAQEALADAIGLLEGESNGRISPKEICTTLAKKDDQDQPHLKLRDPASPFFGVLCHPVDLKMRKQHYKRLATDMFRHLLDGGTSDEQARRNLKKAVFDSRRVTPEGVDPAEAIGLDGNRIKFEDFELPVPW